jgi:hypothetical protein
MSETGDGSGKIKVVDRRRFDDRGELRPDRPLPEKKSAPEPPPEDRLPLQGSQPEPSGKTEDAPTPAKGQDAATSPLFMDLIAGLAQQAEILITGGQGLPAQPAEAQRVIEYLTVLESKTKGNLSVEEQQILSNVIFQLRSLFVQHGHQ